jgi:hypothetical protein
MPYPAVRNFLVQKELGEKWENWMTPLQEYDLEITPAQIVRDQGLCKLVTDSVEEQQGQINVLTKNQHSQSQICCAQDAANSWFDDIKFYLTHGSAPRHLDLKNRRALRLKSAPSQLVNGVLFHKNIDEVFMRCLERDEADKVLSELHAAEAGGHFGGDTTIHKVLRAGYYWPTLFKYVHTLCCKCIICQKASGQVQKT